MGRVKYGFKATTNECSVSQRNFEHSKMKSVSFVFVLIQNLKTKERKPNNLKSGLKKKKVVWSFLEIQSDF